MVHLVWSWPFHIITCLCGGEVDGRDSRPLLLNFGLQPSKAIPLEARAKLLIVFVQIGELSAKIMLALCIARLCAVNTHF